VTQDLHVRFTFGSTANGDRPLPELSTDRNRNHRATIYIYVAAEPSFFSATQGNAFDVGRHPPHQAWGHSGRSFALSAARIGALSPAFRYRVVLNSMYLQDHLMAT